jgi:hypothetical protein
MSISSLLPPKSTIPPELYQYGSNTHLDQYLLSIVCIEANAYLETPVPAAQYSVTTTPLLPPSPFYIPMNTRRTSTRVTLLDATYLLIVTPTHSAPSSTPFSPFLPPLLLPQAHPGIARPSPVQFFSNFSCSILGYVETFSLCEGIV